MLQWNVDNVDNLDGHLPLCPEPHMSNRVVGLGTWERGNLGTRQLFQAARHLGVDFQLPLL